MGEVKDTVKGTSLKEKSLPSVIPRSVKKTTPILSKPETFATRLSRTVGRYLRHEDDAVAETKEVLKSLDKVTGTNLIEHVESLREEVGRLVEIKDADVLSEGVDQAAENVRKGAQLRAVHSLLTSTLVLLEDY